MASFSNYCIVLSLTGGQGIIGGKLNIFNEKRQRPSISIIICDYYFVSPLREKKKKKQSLKTSYSNLFLGHMILLRFHLKRSQTTIGSAVCELG